MKIWMFESNMSVQTRSNPISSRTMKTLELISNCTLKVLSISFARLLFLLLLSGRASSCWGDLFYSLPSAIILSTQNNLSQTVLNKSSTSSFVQDTSRIILIISLSLLSISSDLLVFALLGFPGFISPLNINYCYFSSRPTMIEVSSIKVRKPNKILLKQNNIQQNQYMLSYNQKDSYYLKMSQHSSRLIENLIGDEDENQQEVKELEGVSDMVEMFIELDSEHSVSLYVGPHDDPGTLARKFCYVNNVDPKVIQVLSNNIRSVQNSSFLQQNSYEELIKITNEKENKSLFSNVRHHESGSRSALNKSKLSKHSHHKNNTTFNEDTTLFENNPQTMEKYGSKPSVFDRLYQESKKKYPNKMMNSQETTQKNLNLSKDLSYSQVNIYNKNTKLKQATTKRNEKMKAEKDMKEVEKYSYKPKINPLSNLIAGKLKEYDYGLQSKSQEKSFNRTIDYVRQKQIKQMEECTFHPKILSRNQNETLGIERHYLLHQDSILRQKRAQSIKDKIRDEKQKKQHPQINEVSKRIVEGRSFYDRLEDYNRSSLVRKLKIQEEKKQEQTRRKPSTGRKPLNRNAQGLKIGDYLYSQAFRKSRSQSVEGKQVYTNQKSQKIYEEVKKNAFRYLFTLMDSDEDGFISSLKINILGLDPDILKILSPLLCEMEEIQAQLDEEEFIDSLERLFLTLSVGEKNMVINVYKNPLRKQKSQEPSFQPSLNEKSVLIAREVREPGVSLYELCQEKQAEKESRLSELRALKALMEYEQCTFQPNLFHHHN